MLAPLARPKEQAYSNCGWKPVMAPLSSPFSAPLAPPGFGAVFLGPAECSPRAVPLPINHFRNKIVEFASNICWSLCVLCHHTPSCFMVVSKGVDMEKAMGAIKGQRRLTRTVQLVEIIFPLLFPDWTVVLVLLLMGVDLTQPLFPTV
jgi:hypothetical protein